MRHIFQAVRDWFNSSNISDEEFIERLRTSLATWDRLRRRLFVIYVLSGVVIVGLLIAVCLLLANLLRLGMQGQNAGFALGVILGLLLGELAFKVVYGLVDSLSGGYRSERLLIRYYDAIRQFNREAATLEQRRPRGEGESLIQ
jgi:hypothetical protein